MDTQVKNIQEEASDTMAGFDKLKYFICSNQEILKEKCRNVGEYFEWIFRVRKIKE